MGKNSFYCWLFCKCGNYRNILDNSVWVKKCLSWLVYFSGLDPTLAYVYLSICGGKIFQKLSERLEETIHSLINPLLNWTPNESRCRPPYLVGTCRWKFQWRRGTHLGSKSTIIRREWNDKPTKKGGNQDWWNERVYAAEVCWYDGPVNCWSRGK